MTRVDLKTSCGCCGRSVVYATGLRTGWHTRQVTIAFHILGSNSIPEGYSEVTKISPGYKRRLRRQLERRCYQNKAMVRRQNWNIEEAEALRDLLQTHGIQITIKDIATMQPEQLIAIGLRALGESEVI